jgi:serine/threonine-protein kinase
MRLLGQRGFAEVYLGEHLFLGTAIAIKILHTQVAPEDMVQFQQSENWKDECSGK